MDPKLSFIQLHFVAEKTGVNGLEKFTTGIVRVFQQCCHDSLNVEDNEDLMSSFTSFLDLIVRHFESKKNIGACDVLSISNFLLVGSLFSIVGFLDIFGF